MPTNEQIGLALQRILASKGNYKLIIFGDGSGHTESFNNEHNLSWDNWEEFCQLELPKLIVGVRVMAIADRYAGNTGTVESVSPAGTSAMVKFDGSGLTIWKDIKNLKILSKFAYKQDVRIKAGVHKGETGIVVAVEDDGSYKVWVECDNIVTYIDEDLTAI